MTDVLQILALALALVFLNLTSQTCLLSLRRHRDLLMVNASALVVVIVLTFAFVPPLQARGGALAMVLGEAFLASASALVLLRAHPELRPELRLVPRLVVALAAAVGVASLPGLGDVAAAAISTVVYFAVLVALRVVPTEVRDALVRRGQVA